MYGSWAIAALACGSSGPESSTSGHTDAASNEGSDSASGGSSGSSSSNGGGTSDDGGATPGDGAAGSSGAIDGSGSGAGSDAHPEAAACSDSCPAPNGGVTVGCEKRFLYGVNYAWKNWVADFGGVSAWSQNGVSKNQAAIQTDLQDMQANGVDVVRWWMLQKLEGDAVTFDGAGTPTGVGGTASSPTSRPPSRSLPRWASTTTSRSSRSTASRPTERTTARPSTD